MGFLGGFLQAQLLRTSSLANPGVFNIFEKTQARKNSTAQKTQRFFRPKPVAIVVV